MTGPEGAIEIKRYFRSMEDILPETTLTALWRKTRERIRPLVDGLLLQESFVDEAVAVFSSPWYFSEVRRIFKEENEPIFLSQELIDEILTKEMESFKAMSLSGFNLQEEDIVVLPAEIIQAELNGYPIKNPKRNILGKKAKTVEIVLFLAAVFGDAAGYIQEVFQQKRAGRFSMQSSPYIFYKVLTEAGEDNQLIVNIEGEITEIAVIKNGSLPDAVSFGRGFNFAARRLADIFNIDPAEAMAMIKSYGEKKLEPAAGERLKKVLGDAALEWQRLFEDAIRHLALSGPLPDKIFMIGDGAELEEFRQAAADKIFSRYTILGRPFTVSSSMPQGLKPLFKNLSPDLARPGLMPLSLFSAYKL